MASINIDMNPLKLAIFTEVKAQNEKANAWDDDRLNQLLFRHSDGLRLTYSGFLILKKIFTVYSFEIPATIKTRHQFGMSKMEYPYFFTKRRLMLFSEMDAMVVKIHGGIEGFLEICSRID